MDRPGSGFARLIGLLLVLNLGVLLAGLGLGYWSGTSQPPVSFNGDKIQLFDELSPVRPEVVDEVAEAPAQESPAPEQGPGKTDCLAWRGLDADQVSQVERHLRQSNLADGAYDLQVEMRLGWWVYVPPLANAEALRVVMEDARAKGVKDMAPVRAGAMNNALALGTFPNHEGARKHAQEMTRKGISGVRYGPRPGAGKAQLVLVTDTPQARKALQAAWPAGLAPDACGGE